MSSFLFWDDLDLQFIPREHYLWIQLDQILLQWTFLARNKNDISTFEFGDDLRPQIHPQKDFWGGTGKEHFLLARLDQILFEQTLLARNKVL